MYKRQFQFYGIGVDNLVVGMTMERAGGFVNWGQCKRKDVTESRIWFSSRSQLISLRTDEGNISSGWGALSGEEETDRFFWVSCHDIAAIWVAFLSSSTGGELGSARGAL